MTVSIWFWLVLALLLFWCVGVYNRIMRLKARSVDALVSVEKQTRGYVELIQSQLPSEWSALHSLARALDDAGRSTLSKPLYKATQQEYTRCIDALEAQWADTSAVSADLAGAQELQARWDEARLNVQMARSSFNQIVDSYNEALHQIPARLVVGFMGFRPTLTL